MSAMYYLCFFICLSLGLSGCRLFNDNVQSGKTYVIVGYSAAGRGAAQELMRHVSPQDTVVVISKDPDAFYDRTKLKRYIISDTQSADLTAHNQAGYIVHHTTADHIDCAKKIVTCVDGSSITYDYLFLGIGTEPRVPCIQGMQECGGIFGYYTLHDVHVIKEYMRAHSVTSVVVIGGGLAALEITAALSHQGYAVHQCVRGPRILQEQADQGGAYCIQQLFAHHGVQWHFNTTITQVRCSDDVLTHVILNDTTELAADMIIYAIGGIVKAPFMNVLDMRDGAISIDACMRTSDPFIYAGGDAVSVWDYVNRCFVRSQKWNAAKEQGICAARNMCCGYQSDYYRGSACVHCARYFNTIVAFSGPMGNPPPDYTYTVDTTNGYRALLTKDGQLKGFCLIGMSKDELKEYSEILKKEGVIN